MVAAKSSRVNRQYKKKYRIRNWREYERGLRSRGDVTIWLSEDAIAAWVPPKNGLRGGPAGVFEQNVAFTVAAMRKEEENRVVRWAVVRGFHERTAAPSSEPRRQSRVQVVSLRAASMYL